MNYRSSAKTACTQRMVLRIDSRYTGQVPGVRSNRRPLRCERSRFDKTKRVNLPRRRGRFFLVLRYGECRSLFVGAIHESPGLPRQRIVQRAAGSSAPTEGKRFCPGGRREASPDASVFRAKRVQNGGVRGRLPTMCAVRMRVRLPRRRAPRNDRQGMRRIGHSSFLIPNSSFVRGGAQVPALRGSSSLFR